MADPKSKTPKAVKAETDTAATTVTTDLASGAPAIVVTGVDPVTPVAAGDAPLMGATQPPALLETVQAVATQVLTPIESTAATSAPDAPVSPVDFDTAPASSPEGAAFAEPLISGMINIPSELVEPLELGEFQLELWRFYGRTCKAAVDVLKERCRQVDGEGYAPESDDGYTDYQLPRAAICYAIKAAGLPSHRATLYWPFPAPAFKPTERRANLVKAAALLLAEIERLDRAESAAD